MNKEARRRRANSLDNQMVGEALDNHVVEEEDMIHNEGIQGSKESGQTVRELEQQHGLGEVVAADERVTMQLPRWTQTPMEISDPGPKVGLIQ